MELDLATSYWHSLSYTPGKWMSISWWDALNISHWRSLYRKSPPCQHALDALICKKRGFPDNRPFLPTTHWHRTLLEDIKNLPKLLTALGLIRLARLDFLMLKRYKVELQIYLTSDDIEQLLTIFPEEKFIDERLKVQVEPICEKSLPNLALYLGWSSIFQSDPVWQALAILFPFNFTAQEVSEIDFSFYQQWYIRLRRLL